MLKLCFNTRKRSFVLKQEAMWESFHKLRVSALLKTEWQGFLGAALVVPETPTCPAFTQYVTKEVFHNLICDLNVIPAAGQTAIPDPIREEESHALRYVAGYVCRKVKHKVESSSHPDKKDIVLFLNDLKVIEEGEDSWIKRIDRGGLWHVNEGIYVLFYAMEEIIRQHFTVRSIESLDTRTKDRCLDAVLKSDDIKHHWSTLASHIDDNTGNFVLRELAGFYLTI